ncbi:MAG: PAS domain-containing protein, partial [Planctomycetota bacterium]|nr:PAS domain-containing protein [Planctomycetota bacterium]
MKPDLHGDAAAIRRAAEAHHQQREATRTPLEEGDLRRLQHELEVHQIELEMQNDELHSAQAKIEAGLERYIDLFDFAPVSFFNLSADGTIHLVNLTGASLLGVKRGELLNRRFGLFVAMHDRSNFSDFLDSVFASESRQVCELSLLSADDLPIIVRIKATRSDNGNECRLALMDITDRCKAERKLAASEVHLRTILNTEPECVKLLDKEGRLLDMNQAGLAMVEADSFQQVENQDVYPLLVEQYRKHFRDLIKRVFLGESGVLEYEIVGLKGSRRWLESNATPLRDATGQITALLAITRDLTDRMQAEKTLRMKDHAIQSITQGIVITDATQADNPIVYVNRSFELITGYAASEIEGQNCRFLQGKDTDPLAVTEIRDAIRNARPCTVELLNYRKDGTTFWNQLLLTPVHDDSGRVTQFIGVQIDVTARRTTEAQLQQSQKMETVGQLAGAVAHDFNNLLTIIAGYTSLLLQKSSQSDQSREFLTEIQNASSRATDLTQRLLAFGRQQSQSPERLDVNQVITETLRLLDRLIGKDMQIVTSPDPLLGIIRADWGQISQVLINLVLNARDAMPNGGTITIQTQNVDGENIVPLQQPIRGNHVLISISDTGCGMPPEVQRRIFDPFFTTKPVGKGTGLGLSTVHGIVTQSGGRIEVSSEV